MKVRLSNSLDIKEFLIDVVGANKGFIKNFCKECGLSEMQLILILLDAPVDLDFEIVEKIEKMMKQKLFVPSSFKASNYIRYD